MGDVGSLALGGALGVVAVLIKQEILLLFIGGVYVIEALSVILQVGSYKLRKKRIFKMAPHASSFRSAGMAGIEDHRAVLDCGIGDGAVRADDVEAAIAGMRKLEGTRVVVVGMARTGVAAVELLREQGRHGAGGGSKAHGRGCRRDSRAADGSRASRTRT